MYSSSHVCSLSPLGSSSGLGTRVIRRPAQQKTCVAAEPQRAEPQGQVHKVWEVRGQSRDGNPFTYLYALGIHDLDMTFRCSRNELGWTSIPWLLESFSHYTWLLSCPVYCGPSIIPGFLAGLISGTSLGLLLGFWCFCHPSIGPPAPFFTPAPRDHSQSPPSTWSSQTSGQIVRRGVSRIGQYVHE